MNEIIDYDICEECGGFCCNYMFRIVEIQDITEPILEYFNTVAVTQRRVGDSKYFVLLAKCKYCTDTGCDLGDKKPQLCKEFPHDESVKWAPFCPLFRKIQGEK